MIEFIIDLELSFLYFKYMKKNKILFVCGNPGCGKSTISKHLVKNYLHDFYFLDKDTLYVKLSGEFMAVINNNRYDRDSPLYKQHCREFEYEGMVDCARENAELGKNTLLCAPFGKEFSNIENFIKFKENIELFATPYFIWLEAGADKVKSNILKRGHSFDKYKLDHWDEYISTRKSINDELKKYVHIMHNNDENLDIICSKIVNTLKD